MKYELDPRVYDSDEFYTHFDALRLKSDYACVVYDNNISVQTNAINTPGFDSSFWYDQVKTFMLVSGQEVHDVPTTPSKETIELRARLIMEEALETIAALGCNIKLQHEYLDGDGNVVTGVALVYPEDIVTIEAESCAELSIIDMVGIIDGCCDTIYVTLGTLVSFGIQDAEYMKEVCDNNLSKVYPTCTKANGKVQKPADYQPPRIPQILSNLVSACKEFDLKDETPNYFKGVEDVSRKDGT